MTLGDERYTLPLTPNCSLLTVYLYMIGLIANSEDHDVAREFFELFKTPWEFYRPDASYDVVLCVSQEPPSVLCDAARLMVVYAGHEQKSDQEEKIAITAHRKGSVLAYKGERFPIYGDLLTFYDDGVAVLEEEESRRTAGVRRQVQGRLVIRIGYDLFDEIRSVLSTGQPLQFAAIPTVEIQIGLLRDLIVESGAPLMEIPPVPDGYAFVACLTHDVDHPSIRRHRWDHTAWGFLYRALIGSVLDLFKGRTSMRSLLKNWTAAAKLPCIYLGLARDFWLDFDRYLSLEQHAGSTFFVLPFKGRPGRAKNGSAPRIRAAGYGAEDIADRIHVLVNDGGEIGLHGIDAWGDSTSGQLEKAQIEKVTGAPIAGVRMHWLYFNEESPALLEKAGFTYDSTVGYNETVGYRVGTAQVYKPIEVSHLLELPMHVMDTALFYPAHLNCTQNEARQRVDEIVDQAIRFGGAVTFNWHDRSIAPERLWGEFYEEVLVLLRQRGAWCTSANQTVSWFQQRRAVTFTRSEQGVEIEQRSSHGTSCQAVPGMKVRLYNGEGHDSVASTGYMEIPLQEDTSAERLRKGRTYLKSSGLLKNPPFILRKPQDERSGH